MNHGDIALDFTATTQTGETLTLSALRPQPVVLYFYPKDGTPGCTRQARDFTDLVGEFAAAGARVIGVSKDTVARHRNFVTKQALSITLVSDTATTICEDYGVWGEKTLYGKKFIGITRTTFLIDGAGCIAQVWPKVKLAGHAAEVLAALKTL